MRPNEPSSPSMISFNATVVSNSVKTMPNRAPASWGGTAWHERLLIASMKFYARGMAMMKVTSVEVVLALVNVRIS